MFCFDQGIDAKCSDKNLLYELYLGRAKTNTLIAQFGKVHEDCLQAKKYGDDA